MELIVSTPMWCCRIACYVENPHLVSEVKQCSIESRGNIHMRKCVFTFTITKFPSATIPLPLVNKLRASFVELPRFAPLPPLQSQDITESLTQFQGKGVKTNPVL